MRTRDRKIIYKFYTPAGVYIGNLTEQYFKDFPQFAIGLNGGLSELRLKATFSLDDYNYPPDGILTDDFIVPATSYTGKTVVVQKGKRNIYNCLNIGNLLKIFIVEDGTERQIYSGRYDGNELELKEGGKEDFMHVFTPNVSRLQAKIFYDVLNTNVPYVSADPSQMMRDVIDASGFDLSYTTDSLKDTGVTRSYTFNVQNSLEALQNIIKMTPNRWVWFLGGDDLLYLRNVDDDAQSLKISDVHVISAKFIKSMAYIRNRVLFVGGGTPKLFKQYDAEGSQTAFGIYEQVLIDDSVEDASTAEEIANRYLAENSFIKNYFYLELNGDTYPIEDIKPGDQITLSTDRLDSGFLTWGNFTWGVDYWKYDFNAIAGIPGIVQKITYNFRTAIVECSYNLENQPDRIEKLQQDINQVRLIDAPVAPS